MILQPATDIKSVYQNAESVLAQAERVLKENYPHPPRFRTYSRVGSDPRSEIIDFARKERTLSKTSSLCSRAGWRVSSVVRGGLPGHGNPRLQRLQAIRAGVGI